MAVTEYKKIRIRRGTESELVQANLLPGEFALSTDTGKVRICVSAGNVVILANLQEFQNLLDLSGDAYAALQELIKDLGKESVLTGVLSDVSKLKTSVGSLNDSLSSTRLWTGTASTGDIITLSKGMDNFKTLMFQLGTPGNTTGLQTFYARRWQELNWQNTISGKYYNPCNGGYILLTFDSDTQITVTHTAVAVRTVTGLII